MLYVENTRQCQTRMCLNPAMICGMHKINDVFPVNDNISRLQCKNLDFYFYYFFLYIATDFSIIVVLPVPS